MPARSRRPPGPANAAVLPERLPVRRRRRTCRGSSRRSPAIAGVSGERPWDLVLCGDGPDRDLVASAIAASSRADAFHRPGFLQADELPRMVRPRRGLRPGEPKRTVGTGRQRGCRLRAPAADLPTCRLRRDARARPARHHRLSVRPRGRRRHRHGRSTSWPTRRTPRGGRWDGDGQGRRRVGPRSVRQRRHRGHRAGSGATIEASGSSPSGRRRIEVNR